MGEHMEDMGEHMEDMVDMVTEVMVDQATEEDYMDLHLEEGYMDLHLEEHLLDQDLQQMLLLHPLLLDPDSDSQDQLFTGAVTYQQPRKWQTTDYDNTMAPPIDFYV